MYVMCHAEKKIGERGIVWVDSVMSYVKYLCERFADGFRKKTVCRGFEEGSFGFVMIYVKNLQEREG